MQSEIIRETRKVFIRRKIEQGDRKMTLRMITENHIEGLLRCEIRHMDGESWLYVEITGLRNLKDLYENRTMASEDIPALFTELGELSKCLADHFVSVRQLLLSPEEIYRDVESGAFFFQIGPGERDGEPEKLLDYLITVMDHENDAVVDAVYEAQNQAEKGFVVLEELAEKCKELRHPVKEADLRMEEEVLRREYDVDEPFSWEDADLGDEDLFDGKKPASDPGKHFFKKIGKQSLSIPQWAKTAGTLVLCLAAVYALGSYLNMHTLAVIALLLLVVAAFLLREVLNRVHLRKPSFHKETSETVEDFEESESREGGKRESEELAPEDAELQMLFQKRKPEVSEDGRAPHQTVYLEEEERPFTLYGQGEYQHLVFPIEGDMVTLGQSPEYADLVIPDPTVSRLHARIYRKESGLVIRDLGSLNGSFLNGEGIAPEVDTELPPDSQLTIGRVVFQLR